MLQGSKQQEGSVGSGWHGDGCGMPANGLTRHDAGRGQPAGQSSLHHWSCLLIPRAEAQPSVYSSAAAACRAFMASPGQPGGATNQRGGRAQQTVGQQRRCTHLGLGGLGRRRLLHRGLGSGLGCRLLGRGLHQAVCKTGRQHRSGLSRMQNLYAPSCDLAPAAICTGCMCDSCYILAGSS